LEIDSIRNFKVVYQQRNTHIIPVLVGDIIVMEIIALIVVMVMVMATVMEMVTEMAMVMVEETVVVMEEAVNND
jgi:hypothetical protein